MEQLNWTEVEGSSNITGIAYTAGEVGTDAGTLYVRFGSGAEYKYSNFSDQMAEDFFNAHSKGKFFHSVIKNDWVGVKLEVEEDRGPQEKDEREPDPDDISEVEELRTQTADEDVKLAQALRDDELASEEEF